jgi:flagellar biosynthesis/type III secretory pathway protein FliH
MTPSNSGDPQPAVRTARVVRNADGRAQPLYPATRLLKGAVLDAERATADAVLLRQTTMKECAALHQAALDEAAAVRQAAFDRGAQEAAAEFTGMLQKLETEIDRLKTRFATDVQRVAFRFAKAIIDVEFQAKPERLLQLIEKVLKPAKLYNRVKIVLHPNDVARIRADQQRLAKQLAFAKEIEFAADPKLPPHGVRVETEMGSYDGTIETQIRRLQEHLLPGEAPFPGADTTSTGPSAGSEPA